MAPLRASVHQYCTCAVLYMHTAGTAVTPGVCVVTLSPPKEKPHLTQVRALSECNKTVVTSCLKISPSDLTEQSRFQSTCAEHVHICYLFWHWNWWAALQLSTTAIIYSPGQPYILHHPLLWYTQNYNYDNKNNYPYKISLLLLGA